MQRTFFFFLLLLYSFFSLASQPASFYQIDVIVFARSEKAEDTSEHELSPLIRPEYPKALSLQPYQGEINAFHLLPPQNSALGKEYWALTHKGHYQVLGHYSWLQPYNNKRPVLLPPMKREGWVVEGTLRIRKSNYYVLDTDLLFTTPYRNEPFIFSQNQRLKDDVVYYLDHPQAGMLVKIHKVAA